jgi:chorismate mutase
MNDTEHRIEIDRLRAQIAKLVEERDARPAAVPDLQTKLAAVRGFRAAGESKPTAPAGLVERAKAFIAWMEDGNNCTDAPESEMLILRDLAKAEPVPASSALLLAANAVVPDDPRVHGITPTFLNRGGEDLVGLYDAIAAEEKREPDDARDAAEVVGELLIEARDERDDLKKQLEEANNRICQLLAERSEASGDVERSDWWASRTNIRRVAHGVASRVDRLRALGNGQVPQCVAQAWRILMEEATRA